MAGASLRLALRLVLGETKRGLEYGRGLWAISCRLYLIARVVYTRVEHQWMAGLSKTAELLV